MLPLRLSHFALPHLKQEPRSELTQRDAPRTRVWHPGASSTRRASVSRRRARDGLTNGEKKILIRLKVAMNYAAKNTSAASPVETSLSKAPRSPNLCWHPIDHPSPTPPLRGWSEHLRTGVSRARLASARPIYCRSLAGNAAGCSVNASAQTPESAGIERRVRPSISGKLGCLGRKGGNPLASIGCKKSPTGDCCGGGLQTGPSP